MGMSHREELANCITHGIGVALSLVGMGILMTLACLAGGPWHIVSCSVFGTSLILLYTTSTLYHGFRTPRIKAVLRRIDHSCIFVLIAGTYTPFMLVTLRGPWGWSLFGVVWGIALLGILFKVFFMLRSRGFSVALYVVMGWLIVIAIGPLVREVPASGLAWIIAGGLLYTGGTIFYLWKRLPYNHSIWHLFVLGGSACHYTAVLLYVIPPLTGVF